MNQLYITVEMIYCVYQMMSGGAGLVGTDDRYIYIWILCYTNAST